MVYKLFIYKMKWNLCDRDVSENMGISESMGMSESMSMSMSMSI